MINYGEERVLTVETLSMHIMMIFILVVRTSIQHRTLRVCVCAIRTTDKLKNVTQCTLLTD